MVATKRKVRRDVDVETVRVSVFIPRELARRLKAHAARQGESVSQVVAAWIDTQTEG